MSELIRILKNIYKPAKPVKPGAEDVVDRLNFVWTPVLLLLCSLVVFGKEYVSKPIYCIYNGQNHPNGWADYADTYCWSHGTYAYSKELAIELTGFNSPKEQKNYWSIKKSPQLLTYYQWVPFFLLLMCIAVYVPKLAWQAMCNDRYGSDIYSLVSLSAESKTADAKTFQQVAARIADVIERVLICNRDLQEGRLQRVKTAVYKRCCFLIPSKRLSTELTVGYLFMKLMCIVTAVLMLVMMAVFLGFWQRGIYMFGWIMLLNLTTGNAWQGSPLFPIQTLCYVPTRIDLGASGNAYVGHCSLPVNILNEKIFIALWFWFVFLAAATTLSTVRWLYRLLYTCNRVNLVKRLLRVSDPCLHIEKPLVRQFISKFLRRDGVFLVLLMGEASDKIITSEVVRLLYHRWSTKHHGCDLRRGDSCTLDTLGQKVRPSYDIKDDVLKTQCTSAAADESGLMP